MTTQTIYLHDEAPRIGCGWRKVEVISIGHKWAIIRYHGTRARLKRAVWDAVSAVSREES